MAKKMIDYTATSANDLVINGGDFLRGECTPKHQQELILSGKNDFKQSPTICVGVFNYLDDENPQDLVRAISIEFARDGCDVKSVTINSDGTIRTDAFYK